MTAKSNLARFPGRRLETARLRLSSHLIGARTHVPVDDGRIVNLVRLFRWSVGWNALAPLYNPESWIRMEHAMLNNR
jgi:hypothetical protein